MSTVKRAALARFVVYFYYPYDEDKPPSNDFMDRALAALPPKNEIREVLEDAFCHTGAALGSFRVDVRGTPIPPGRMDLFNIPPGAPLVTGGRRAIVPGDPPLQHPSRRKLQRFHDLYNGGETWDKLAYTGLDKLFDDSDNDD